MTLPIQLISTDFDGTIYAEFEDPPVPPRVQELIGALQARGAKWVINTGRDLPSLLEAVARARLSIRPDYLVLVEREIYFHSGSEYLPLEEWNRRCEAEQAALFERIRPDLARLVAWVNANFDAMIYSDPYSPLCLLARNSGDTDAIQAYLEDYCREVPRLTVVRNDVYARFSHAAYNKGTGLAEVARLLGISRDRIFAAGDHLNDLPMLSKDVARWLVAPANAVEPVKAAVRAQGGLVSDQPHGYGVAHGLEYFLDGHR